MEKSDNRTSSPQYRLDSAWLQENANQLVHYRDKIGVCNIICFCQCQKHESIALLLVKPRDKQSKYIKQPMFVLPGGKRDLKVFKQTEPCWDAIVREFQEEVDEDLNVFCKKKCRFFEETIQVNVDLNMVTDVELKEVLQSDSCKYITNPQILVIENRNKEQKADNCSDSSISEDGEQPISTPNELPVSTQVTRRIRSYFIEIECDDLPDKTFGRFNLYEMTERKWFSLEEMILQFKSNKQNMIISPKMFKCISKFGGKLVNIQQKQLQKLNFVYLSNQTAITIDDQSDSHIEQPVEQTQEFLNNLIKKINKTHTLFARINPSIKKQPMVLKFGQDILYI